MTLEPYNSIRTEEFVSPLSAIRSARDVLVIPLREFPGSLKHPSVSQEQVFANGVHLGPADQEEALLVFNACSPRGHNFFTRNANESRYVFWRSVDIDELNSAEARMRWDVEGAISRTIQLSRYIRDNSHWIEFAARIIEYENGLKQVLPFSSSYPECRSQVHRLLPDDPGYLSDDECAELATLIEKDGGRSQKLPQRVSAAMFFAEYASFSNSIEPFIATLYMSIEALLNTTDVQVSKQMKKRLPLLAQAVGVAGMSNTLADKIYDARGIVIHQVHDFPLLVDQPSKFAELAKRAALVQRIVRATIRRCIEDASFAASFDSTSSVDAAFPV